MEAASVAILSRRFMTRSTMTCMARIEMIRTGMEKLRSGHRRKSSADHDLRSLWILLASSCRRDLSQFLVRTWSGGDLHSKAINSQSLIFLTTLGGDYHCIRGCRLPEGSSRGVHRVVPIRAKQYDALTWTLTPFSDRFYCFCE